MSETISHLDDIPAQVTAPTVEIAVKLMAIRRPIDPVFTPDGKRLAFGVAQVCKTADGPPPAQIFISDFDGNAQVVSEAGWTALNPRWSPSGNVLAFVSDQGSRGSLSHIFLRDEKTPAPTLVADLGGTIEDMVWDSEDTLILLVADAGAENISMYGAARPQSNKDPEVTTPVGFWHRLKRLNVRSGEIVEVGPAGWNIWEFSLAAPNRAVAIGSEEPTENGWYHSSVLDLDLSTRQARVIHKSDWLIASPVLSPDLTRIAFVEGWASDRGLLMGQVRLYDLRNDSLSAPLPIPCDVSWMKWRDEATLYFAGISGLETGYGWMDVNTQQVQYWSEKATLRSRALCEVTPSPDGTRVAAVIDRFEAPWELAWREFSDETPQWHFITHVNQWWSDHLPPWTVRRVTWQGRDGLDLEGFLVEPKGGGRRPMLVNSRGGPTFPYRYSTLSMIASAAAEAGYNVFLPAPRGTPGRGQAFTRANVGDPGGEELYDILTGMDACVEMGVAIPDKIAIGGGSYSGYLTAWAVTQHSERFACAVLMYGISNNVSCHRTCNNARFYEFILQARPVGQKAIAWYMERSPITYIEQCKTPTIVLHGELDLCTPLGQGIEFYQGLADQGTPTELVVYPREGHAMGNWEPGHQIDFSHRVQAWLEHYLGSPSQ